LARALVNHTRGDVLKYSDDDSTMPGTVGLCAAIDELVLSLKSCSQVSERLSNTDFANSAMCSVYPGGAARYIKHTDNSLMTDGRRLTTILYLNKDWKPSYGGQLRVYEPTMQSTRIKRDVKPVFNRLLLFWSNEEVPHEVLSSFRDRAAVSIWYVCARECLQTEEAFTRLVAKSRCIGGQDRASCLSAAATTPAQQKLLRSLGASDLKALSPADASERRDVMDAIQHDFGGCERHRRQREKLSCMFGWDERRKAVEREMLASQAQQMKLFASMGLPLPPGVRSGPSSSMASTAPPALTEEYVRRTRQPLQPVPASCSVSVAQQSRPRLSAAVAVPALFPDGVRRPLPAVFEVVD